MLFRSNDGVYGAEEDRRSPTHAPGFSLISTALIIRVGGKLLCQLFFGFMWFSWCELGGFWRVEGLDTAILRGNSRKKSLGAGSVGGRP